jgi:hypothetical protein
MGFVQLSLMGWGMLILGLIILILGMALKVQSSRLHSEKEAHEATKIQYRTFVSETKRRGEAAAKKAKAQEAADRKRKEAADAENKRLRNDNVALTRRLRDANPPRSELPEAPASSSRPDLICLDRAEYQRENGKAIARLFEGARGLADEGTANTIDLDTAKRWAQPE